MHIYFLEDRYAQVLDHTGYMSLEGNFSEMVAIEAARICTGTEVTGDNQDIKLLKKLLELGHNTPLEHIVMRWKVKLPIFVARQWMRHRVGTFNEKSLRYTVAERSYYVPRWNPGVDEYIKSFHRQGDYSVVDSDQNPLDKRVTHEHAEYILQTEMSIDRYEHMLASHRWRREEIRGMLPVCMYTEFIWTVNAWSFMNWLNKRLDKHAQVEHRAYAVAGLGMFMQAFPILGQAYVEHNKLDQSSDPMIAQLLMDMERMK